MSSNIHYSKLHKLPKHGALVQRIKPSPPKAHKDPPKTAKNMTKLHKNKAKTHFSTIKKRPKMVACAVNGAVFGNRWFLAQFQGV